MKVYSQLERAQAENRASDYTGGTALGLIWVNTSDKALKYDDGTNVITLASKDQVTAFTIANNQSVAADVTGLSFSSASVHRAKIEIAVRRRTDDSELDVIGTLWVYFKKDAETWHLDYQLIGDDIGVEFTITEQGQVQYTSTNQPGDNYAGILCFDVVKRYASFAD